MVVDRRQSAGGPAAEDVAWIGTAATIAVALAAAAWLAPAVDGLLAPPGGYHPFPAGKALFFAPEPLEETRFLFALAAPALLAVAVLILGRRRPADARLDSPVIALQLIALGVIGWAVTETRTDLLYFPNAVAARAYLPDDVFGMWFLVAGVAIGLALAVLVFLARNSRAILARLQHTPLAGIRWLPALLALVATVIWLLPAIVTDADIGDTALLSGHIPVQFEDYVSVANGRTPLVDFVPWYASVLPLAIGPIIAAFDSSVTAYSLSMFALTLAALLCGYAALANITGRPWVALCLFIPFLAISFVPWHLGTGDVRIYSALYYAAFPDRYLGPFVVIWLLTRRLRRGSPPLWTVYLAVGLTLLNNFDFGSCCLAATIVASAFTLDRSASLRAQLSDLLPQAAAGMGAALLLVSAVTLIRAGHLPDPSILTYTSSVFGRSGFGLLPMPLWGLHWALYVTYAGALITAAVRWIRFPEERVLTPMLAFLAVFGLATGQYFAGRSEGTQLIVLLPIWGFTIALLTWLVGESLLGVRPGAARRSVVPAVAVLIGFGLMVAEVARVPAPWGQMDRILSGSTVHLFDLPAQQRFVATHTVPGEDVLIMSTPLDHRIAERAGVTNVSPWGTNALFSQEEVDRTLDNLEGSGGRKLFANLPALSPDAPLIEQILRTRGFRLAATDPNAQLDLWIRGA